MEENPVMDPSETSVTETGTATAGDQSPQTSTDAVTPGVEPSSTNAAPDNVLPFNPPATEEGQPGTETPPVEPPAEPPPPVPGDPEKPTEPPKEDENETFVPKEMLGKVFKMADGTPVVLVKAGTLARIFKSAKTGKLPSQLTGMGGVTAFCDMLGIKSPHPKNGEELGVFIDAHVQL